MATEETVIRRMLSGDEEIVFVQRGGVMAGAVDPVRGGMLPIDQFGTSKGWLGVTTRERVIYGYFGPLGGANFGSAFRFTAWREDSRGIAFENSGIGPEDLCIFIPKTISPEALHGYMEHAFGPGSSDKGDGGSATDTETTADRLRSEDPEALSIALQAIQVLAEEFGVILDVAAESDPSFSQSVALTAAYDTVRSTRAGVGSPRDAQERLDEQLRLAGSSAGHGPTKEWTVALFHIRCFAVALTLFHTGDRAEADEFRETFFRFANDAMTDGGLFTSG